MCWILLNFYLFTFRDFYPIFHYSANTITNARAATSDSEPTVSTAVNWATAGKAEDEAERAFNALHFACCFSWQSKKLMFLKSAMNSSELSVHFRFNPHLISCVRAWMQMLHMLLFWALLIRVYCVLLLHRLPSGVLLQFVVWPLHQHPLELSHRSHPSLHHNLTAKLLAHLVCVEFWN